jgi:hypothetical protein
MRWQGMQSEYCQQCRQPLEEWKAGFCEGCGTMAEFRYSVSTIIAGKYESLGPVKEIDDAEKIAPVILDGCGPADVFVKLGNRIVDSFVVTSKGIVRNGKLRKVRTCSETWPPASPRRKQSASRPQVRQGLRCRLARDPRCLRTRQAVAGPMGAADDAQKGTAREIEVAAPALGEKGKCYGNIRYGCVRAECWYSRRCRGDDRGALVDTLNLLPTRFRRCNMLATRSGISRKFSRPIRSTGDNDPERAAIAQDPAEHHIAGITER